MEPSLTPNVTPAGRAIVGSTVRSATLEKFWALELRLLEAFRLSSLGAIGELLHEDFSIVSLHGQEYGRTDFLVMRFDQSAVFKAKLISLELICSGENSVVKGTMDAEWIKNDVKTSAKLVFTHVWVQVGSHFKLLHVHLSDARLADAWQAVVAKLKN